jgi:hypothetical protein
MIMLRFVLALVLAAASPALAAPVRFTPLSLDAYQSFVGSWTPDNAPLCAEINSAARWNAVLHPAAVMGADKAFAPAPSFWTSHMVLLLARVVPAGGEGAFTAPSITSTGRTLRVSYDFTAPPLASSTMKGYLALAVPKSTATSVVFRQNGRRVCALHPAVGAWLSPPAG